MRTGTTLIVAAIALVAGGSAGYRLALTKPEAVAQSVAPQGDLLRGAVDGQKTAKKLLYYRNPMGLPDTSPVPKKDPMGMDYIAVYDGEEPDMASSQIKISVDKVQKLGVRSEP
ncbi:MAG: efflux RND transporter periplasmic adaptor subunit, partial [Azonexus sp.]